MCGVRFGRHGWLGRHDHRRRSIASGDPATDKLAQVLARGTVVMFTDPNYPPSSEAVKGAARPADTKCLPNQLTGPQITGYDAETSKAVAKALGVEPCFVEPSWTEVEAGNWADRWDIAWGSGASTRTGCHGST